jgi:CO/xanthine dehydrogenase Mo-binding subunit
MPVSTAEVTRASFKHAAHRPSAQNRGSRQQAEGPGGIGETGATAGPPALPNPIYAANGVALRRVRIDRKALATSGKA